MRKLFLISLISFVFLNIKASERKFNFNDGWKFHRGSIANAEHPKFNDSKWRVLDLPHDWSVEPAPIQKEGITIGPFSKLNEGGAGGADVGQTLGGEGWYRKTFTITEDEKDKLYKLYFEGIYNQSEVWINGKKVYFNPYGYTSYKVDITSYCNAPGIPNIIAVRAVNVEQNSRWYSGSGIYRHVWLIKNEKQYIEEWDTYVDASKMNGKDAEINLTTVIHNQLNNTTNLDFTIKIISPDKKEVFSSTENKSISKETSVSSTFIINKPQLWSIDNPKMYIAELSISKQGKKLDQITIPFGIRTISFSADEGFQLNGQTIKLKGGCIHHDNGLLGAVAINRAEEKKVELLKANGYNAVRCAHNQVSEYFRCL